MKLLLIRHGDPDYENDSLTPKGFIEAELLSKRLEKTKIDYYYVSPLGRAIDTAAPTLMKKKVTAIECDWLKEFQGTCLRPDKDKEIICWDWLPKDWAGEKDFYDKDKWLDSSLWHSSSALGNRSENIRKEYEYVCNSFDELMKNHGYVYNKNGGYYDVVTPNNDTIAFFCHFGVSVVILSHILGISPMPLWHGLVAAPSSVTTIATEERTNGIAHFRVSGYGDISHLFAAGEDPAFAARFCECYNNIDERH